MAAAAQVVEGGGSRDLWQEVTHRLSHVWTYPCPAQLVLQAAESCGLRDYGLEPPLGSSQAWMGPAVNVLEPWA